MITENKEQAGEKYLNELINRYYPELKETQIELQAGWFLQTSNVIRPIFGAIGNIQDGQKHIIFYDPSLFEYDERMHKGAYEGALAHELSHIIKKEQPNQKNSFLSRITASLRESGLVDTIMRNKNEIDVDRDVIKRGLGEKLLEAKQLFGVGSNGYSSKELSYLINKGVH